MACHIFKESRGDPQHLKAMTIAAPPALLPSLPPSRLRTSRTPHPRASTVAGNAREQPAQQFTPQAARNRKHDPRSSARGCSRQLWVIARHNQSDSAGQPRRHLLTAYCPGDKGHHPTTSNHEISRFPFYRCRRCRRCDDLRDLAKKGDGNAAALFMGFTAFAAASSVCTIGSIIDEV